MSDQPRPEVLRHTVHVVSAHLAHNQVAADALPQLIRSVYKALSGLGAEPVVADALRTPAVPIRKSVFPDYIICLEDGAKLKMLKRYLQSRFGLTPAAYRERWGLPPNYPMVAPAYASMRSGMAKQIGLGRKRAPAAAVGEDGTQNSDGGQAPQDETVEGVTVTKVPARKARGSKG